MTTLPNCPECNDTTIYEANDFLNCPECGHEWTPQAEPLVKDANNGTPLAEGDTVSVIKDLKVKGSSLVVKVGTKVKNIHLVDGDHDIDCKIPGIGAMGLKSEFVKKVTD